MRTIIAILGLALLAAAPFTASTKTRTPVCPAPKPTATSYVPITYKDFDNLATWLLHDPQECRVYFDSYGSLIKRGDPRTYAMRYGMVYYRVADKRCSAKDWKGVYAAAEIMQQWAQANGG